MFKNDETPYSTAIYQCCESLPIKKVEILKQTFFAKQQSSHIADEISKFCGKLFFSINDFHRFETIRQVQ
ncbi:hypothetical protein T4A_11178 [Trichinella pseudospiralis]|uniref:Uncharacterized protein n=1 Tax=Trichinella pseudospiralis TaxID=6337 RepID=A0A0V1DXC3_TRIPS|nr:hypothetical protein T4A_11178 [Trichinella pseudospiralis]